MLLKEQLWGTSEVSAQTRISLGGPHKAALRCRRAVSGGHVDPASGLADVGGCDAQGSAAAGGERQLSGCGGLAPAAALSGSCHGCLEEQAAHRGRTHEGGPTLLNHSDQLSRHLDAMSACQLHGRGLINA